MMRSILVMVLFAFSASVYADGFNYNSVTLSYGQMQFDDLDVDGDSIGISGSFEVGEKFFLAAGYGKSDIGDNFISADIDSWSAGVGYHMPMSDRFDLVTSLSYEYVDISVDGFGSESDNGIGIGAGVRFAATEKFEIDGGVSYVDYSDGGDDTSFGLGFLYNFTDSFSAGASGNWGDDTSAYGIGGRFYFGN